MVKSEYIKWLKSDKQFIVIFALICFYMYVLQPIKMYSGIFEEPINIIEPFLILIGNGYCILIIMITFTVLMIDYPDTSKNIIFQIIRMGRVKWYKGQVTFAILAAISLLTSFLIFSVLLMITNSFSANIWSNAIKMINLNQYDELKTQYPLAILDLSIINNFTVSSAAIYGILLMLLHFIFTAQLQMVLTLSFNKVIGLCGNLIVIGLGLISWAGDSKLKWLLPLSHSTIGWHYDELYNKTIFPILSSLFYMIAINIFVYAAGKKVIQKKMLTLLNQGG